MDRMRGRADKFRDFLSDTCCTCLSSVPSFALVVLAIVLVMLLIAMIPLAFALTYWNPQAQHSTALKASDYPIENKHADFLNKADAIKMPPMIKSSDFLPANITSCRGFGFSCTNDPSEVIGTNKRCDGYKDCIDGSDELNCHQCQTSVSCLKSKHLNCLRGEHICGGKTSHCDGGFDEKEHCNRSTCSENQYKCANSQTCISKQWMCDGDNHCPQKDDEKLCEECQAGSKMCKPSQRCIPKWQVCDGVPDCADFSDEMDCDCKDCSGNGNVLCNGVQKMCLPIKQVCDGTEQCPNGEDEFNCPGFCKSSEKVNKMIECSDGTMMDWRYACGSIEDNTCDASSCTECFRETSLSCSLSDNTTERICLPRGKVCDGLADCPDGSDEFDCGCAHASDFHCPDGKCIKIGKRCDGFKDCVDGSDEANCTKCGSGFFCAADKACIGSRKVCDGRSDCSDAQDELSCSCEQCGTHPYKMYYCSGSKRCFRVDDVCDPFTKCPTPSPRDKLFCAVRESKGIAML